MATAGYGWAAERYEDILAMRGTCGACTSKITAGDTLKLLGESMPAPLGESTAVDTSTETDLEKELLLLSSQNLLLRHHKENLEEAMELLETRTQLIRRLLLKSTRLKYLPGAVVHFVNLLTKANRYFEFKEFARRKPAVKHASSAIKLAQAFFHDDEIKSRFREMGSTEILEAAHAIYMDMYYRKCGKNFYAEPEEDPMLTNYIYNIVFQTREKGYDMDSDPRAELKKMMESEPSFFDDQFCFHELHVTHSDESIQKACDEYENLVRLMDGKYKKAVGRKSSSRKRSFHPGVMEEVSEKRK